MSFVALPDQVGSYVAEPDGPFLHRGVSSVPQRWHHLNDINDVGSITIESASFNTGVEGSSLVVSSLLESGVND